MSDIIYGLARKYVERCQQELSEMLDSSGVLVIDNSFTNGFLARRMFREGFYPTVSEAFYAEALFQENFYNNLPDNVVFPAQMRQEHSDGIDKLFRGMEDPKHALVHRWGGKGGEPAVAEYKMIPHHEDDSREAQKNIGKLIRALQFGSHVQRMLPAEAHILGKAKPLRHESSSRVSSIKRYHQPEPVRYHGHFQKDIDYRLLGRGFHEVVVKPLARGRSAEKNKDNDRQIFETCKIISRFSPVTLATADNDFKEHHREEYSSGKKAEDHGITVLHDGHKYFHRLSP